MERSSSFFQCKHWWDKTLWPPA